MSTKVDRETNSESTMRNIVKQFIENPRPALRKQLTTMELKYALAEVEKAKNSEGKKADQKTSNPSKNK